LGFRVCEEEEAQTHLKGKRKRKAKLRINKSNLPI